MASETSELMAIHQELFVLNEDLRTMLFRIDELKKAIESHEWEINRIKARLEKLGW